ncbi:MAG: NTP transferase domain-containing protein [Candidatus Binatia bacterium]
MIAAVVLSAGESSRMGRPKALLSLEGTPFIERIVSVFKASRVGKIVVVLGHHAKEIKPRIQQLPINIVINKDYAKGQLSSLIVALQSLEAEKSEEKVDGVLVHLVDHPFLNHTLINDMIEKFYDSKKLIVVPRYRGKRGHPVLFARRLFPELLSTPLDLGAKGVVRAHRDETLEIETEDEGVVIDIDTPEEYRKRLGGDPWPK